MTPDEEAGAVALDLELERFAIALAAANFRFLVHQLQDLREYGRRFLDLLAGVGGAAVRVAGVLHRGFRRQILRLGLRYSFLARRTRPRLLALWPRLPWRLRWLGRPWRRRFRFGRLRRSFGPRAVEALRAVPLLWRRCGGGAGGGAVTPLVAATCARRETRTRASRAPSPSNPERGVARTSITTSSSAAPSCAKASAMACSTVADETSIESWLLMMQGQLV